MIQADLMSGEPFARPAPPHNPDRARRKPGISAVTWLPAVPLTFTVPAGSLQDAPINAGHPDGMSTGMPPESQA